MKNISVKLDSLNVSNNGKPKTKEGVVLDRKSSYLLTLTLFSPGANKDKAIVTVKGINDIQKRIDFMGLNETTQKPYTLEDRSVLTGKINGEAEITATLHYVEYESIVLTAMKNFFKELVGSLDLDSLIGALSMTGMVSLVKSKLIDVAKTLPKMLKGERGEHLYEVGYGTLSIAENVEPLPDIGLEVVKEVVRDISYMRIDKTIRLEDVIVVPKGDNGLLKLDIKIT